MKRRRATVIVEDERGILFVRQHGERWLLLPGGGIEPDELPDVAAIRELREETTLTGTASRLFAFESASQQHEVYAVAAEGSPLPSHEIAELCWVKREQVAVVRTSDGTRGILAEYLKAA